MKLPPALNVVLRNSYVMLLRETFSEWSEDKASRLAAALAYFTLFSLAPLLLIVVFIAGLVFGVDAARGQLVRQIEGVVGSGSAQTIQTMIAAVGRDRPGGILSTAVGIVTLLLGASGVFGALQDSLNTVWDVDTKKKRSLMQTIRERFAPFTMIVGIGFLMLIMLVISAAMAGLADRLSSVIPGSTALWFIGNYGLSFVVIAVLFAAIFKILPDKDIAWRDVLVGALATALLFVIGKELIGLYLGRTAASSAYGAAASLVVILIWLYYSSQILLFGAEFTKVWARKYGQAAKATSMGREVSSAMPLRPAAIPIRGAVAEEIRSRQAADTRIPVVTFVVALIGIALGWMLARRKQARLPLDTSAARFLLK